MPSTPTTRIRANKQGQFENVDAWAGILNQALDTIDEAFGFAEVAVNGNVTLTTANFSTDQSRRSILRFVGTGGGFNVVIPPVEKMYFIDNRCTSSIVLKTAAAAGASILPGAKIMAYCDGTTVTVDSTGMNSTAQQVSVSAAPLIVATEVQGALVEVRNAADLRLRVDTPQGLSTAQRDQALQNLGRPYIVTSASGSFNYRQWSDGLIEQWGKVVTADGVDPVATYPLAFATACDSLTATVSSSPLATVLHSVSAIPSLTNATFYGRYAVNGGGVDRLPVGFTIYWRASGR